MRLSSSEPHIHGRDVFMVASLERIAGGRTFRMLDGEGNFVDVSGAPFLIDGQVVLVSDPEMVAKYEGVNVVSTTPAGIVYPGRVGDSGQIILLDGLYRGGKGLTHDGMLKAAKKQVAPGEPRPLNILDGHHVLMQNFGAHKNQAYDFLAGRIKEIGEVAYKRAFRFATFTTFNPVDEESVIEHYNLDGTVSTQRLAIPEGTQRFSDFWSYVVLAPQQSASRLGKTSAIPATVRPTLAAFLGENFEQAGAAYQLHSPPLSNGDLREVRFYLPTAQNRDFTGSFVGGVDNVGRFYLYPSVYLNDQGPALAGAQKISTGNEGYALRAK